MTSQVVIGRAVLTLALAAGPAAAQQGLGFPIVGMGTGQAIRLNVLNLAAIHPSNKSTCSVELQFLDISGKQLKQNSFQVTAGQAAFLELKPSDLPKAGRVEIRAVAMVGQIGGAGPPAIRPTDCGSLLPSLEVYALDTGNTTLLITSTIPLPPPVLLPQ